MNGSHVTVVIAAAALPLLFLVIMTFAEWLVDPKPFWQVAVQTGWDMCILGLGLAAGLFTDRDFVAQTGGSMAVVATSFVLGIDLFFALVVLALKKYRRFSPAGGSFSVTLGVLAVAIPCLLLLTEVTR
ncbi:MAG TPA: hypothetical protein VLC46_24140 [Thermoanaerobaculia bacterium]|nr:hypothetical protein [Thermoanaerobaculia bacterium]